MSRFLFIDKINWIVVSFNFCSNLDCITITYISQNKICMRTFRFYNDYIKRDMIEYIFLIGNLFWLDTPVIIVIHQYTFFDIKKYFFSFFPS